MSFWDWLTRRKTYEQLPDMIWLEDAMATRMCVKEVRTRLAEDALVMVVAHFPDRIDQIAAELEKAAISFERVAESLSGQKVAALAGNRRGVALVVPADLLQPGEPSQAVTDDRNSVSILIRERHPLRSEDEKIENFAASIPWHTRLQCFLSLNDPLLAAFVGSHARQMLKQMGMKPEESIESTMVGRRIKDAQRKLERKALGYNPQVRSSWEWFERMPHANRPAGPWDEKYFPK